jgi:hypothetical protein
MRFHCPESTQYEILQEAALALRPVFDELIRQAAQGEVLHHDDTGMKILARPHAAEALGKARAGTFTSATVAPPDRPVLHRPPACGRESAAVLAHRAAELDAPI